MDLKLKHSEKHLKGNKTLLQSIVLLKNRLVITRDLKVKIHHNYCFGSKEDKIRHQEQNKDLFYNVFVISFEWCSKVKSKTHQSHWVEDGWVQYLLISCWKCRDRTPLVIMTF